MCVNALFSCRKRTVHGRPSASPRPRLLARIPSPKPGPLLERAERSAPRLSNELRPDFGAETCTESWAVFRTRNLGRFKKLVHILGYQVGPLSRRRACDFRVETGPFSWLRSLGPPASRSGPVPFDMWLRCWAPPSKLQGRALSILSHHFPPWPLVCTGRLDSLRQAGRPPLALLGQVPHQHIRLLRCDCGERPPPALSGALEGRDAGPSSPLEASPDTSLLLMRC